MKDCVGEIVVRVGIKLPPSSMSLDQRSVKYANECHPTSSHQPPTAEYELDRTETPARSTWFQNRGGRAVRCNAMLGRRKRCRAHTLPCKRDARTRSHGSGTPGRAATQAAHQHDLVRKPHTNTTSFGSRTPVRPCSEAAAHAAVGIRWQVGRPNTSVSRSLICSAVGEVTVHIVVMIRKNARFKLSAGRPVGRWP